MNNKNNIKIMIHEFNKYDTQMKKKNIKGQMNIMYKCAICAHVGTATIPKQTKPMHTNMRY